MDHARALCLVGPDDAERRDVAERLAGQEVRGFGSVDDVLDGLEDQSTLLIVTRTVPCAKLLDLARLVADGDRDWIVLQVEEKDGEMQFRPVSTGFPVGSDRVAGAVSEEEEDLPVFDLLEVLRRVARVRHDINNPLTAGLAETQLLLMDVEEDDELRESLETIQRQLRRIQGLVERLSHLRRPTRRVG